MAAFLLPQLSSPLGLAFPRRLSLSNFFVLVFSDLHSLTLTFFFEFVSFSPSSFSFLDFVSQSNDCLLLSPFAPFWTSYHPDSARFFRWASHLV